MDAKLVLQTLNGTISRHGVPKKLILHTDQGSQYTSGAYEKALKQLKIQHSYSRKGCPYDNACIESFHVTLKKELVHQLPVYDSFKTVSISLFDYIFRFYNRLRIHSALDYLTPFEIETNCLAQAS